MFYFLLYCEQTNQDEREIKTVKEVHRKKRTATKETKNILQKKEYKKNTSTYRISMRYELVCLHSTAVTK